MEQEPQGATPASTAPSTRVPSPSRHRVREGGRSERVRRAVGEAVLTILAEGRWQFSVVEVAERAGVNRRTLYRWWPTTADLVAEALDQHVPRVPVPVPTGGPWPVDVRAFAHALAEFAADPVEIATAALLAGRAHPELADVVTARYRPVLEAWREMASAARDRGELNADLDPESVMATLVAPLLLQPLMTGRPVGPDDVDKLVDVVLAASR